MSTTQTSKAQIIANFKKEQEITDATRNYYGRDFFKAL